MRVFSYLFPAKEEGDDAVSNHCTIYGVSNSSMKSFLGFYKKQMPCAGLMGWFQSSTINMKKRGSVGLCWNDCCIYSVEGTIDPRISKEGNIVDINMKSLAAQGSAIKKATVGHDIMMKTLQKTEDGETSRLASEPKPVEGPKGSKQGRIDLYA